MNDQNGFDSNGVYHFSYSQPSDPWDLLGLLPGEIGRAHV